MRKEHENFGVILRGLLVALMVFACLSPMILLVICIYIGFYNPQYSVYAFIGFLSIFFLLILVAGFIDEKDEGTLKEVHTPIELSRGTHEPIKLDKPKTATRQNSPHTTTQEEFSEFVIRRDVKDFVKGVKLQAIREANIQRRKDTLGYGVKGKFRPRPAHEKRLWKLDKKPEED